MRHTIDSPIESKERELRKKRLRENNPGKRKSDRNDIRVLQVLLDYPNGLGAKSLSKKTGINRKYIPIICERLINRNYISQGKGERGLYKIEPEISNDSGFLAFLFGDEALRRVLGNSAIRSDIFKFQNISKKSGIVDRNEPNSSRFCNTKLAEEIVEKHRLLLDGMQNRHRRSIGREAYNKLTYGEIANHNRSTVPYTKLLEYDSLQLFEFASRIGFYVTYVLLQSLNPNEIHYYSQHSTTTMNSGISDSTGNNDSSSLIDKRWSLAWMENAINPRNLLEGFIEEDFIRERLKLQPSGGGLPVLEADRVGFDYLTRALATAYPSRYYKEIDAIRTGYAREVQPFGFT